jgi:hypothetical protein
MEFELYKEMMEEQGVSARDRVHKSIDQFEKVHQEGLLQQQFDAIMGKMKESKDLIMKGHASRFEQIQETFNNVLKKYPENRRLKRKRARGIGVI